MNKQVATELAEQAKQLHEAGQLDRAIACYRQAIELDARCYDYYYQLGRLLQQQGLTVQASLYYYRAIEVDKDCSWAYNSLGEVLAQQGEITTAIDCYRSAIALNPDFSWSYYNLGRILHQQNRLDEAMNCYCKALKIDSQYSWSHHFLAGILTKKGQAKLAINHYRQAINFNSNFYVSYYELGVILQKEGQHQEAIDCHLKVIELKPNHFCSYYYLGNIFTKLGEFTQAINYYQQAIELNPKYLQTYFFLGQILLDRGQQALEDYRNSIEDKSKLFQVYFELGLGRAWQKKSNLATAIDCYIKAIKLDPYQELPYKILQYIEIPPEKINEIITFYRKLTTDIPTLNLAWGNLGHVLTQADKPDEAINCFRSSCYYNAVNTNSELTKLNWEIKKEKPPNFIIIGAAKCGTSSLFEYLQQHPQVLLPYKKEINFFDKHFDKDINWYLAHFPAITDYDKFVTGEATTQYIFSPEVERRIYDVFPGVKIIIMLRNPVERTISDYYHHVNRGLETRSLKTIIRVSKESLNKIKQSEFKYSIDEFDYILKSIYYYQVKRWIKKFKNSNTLIINSGHFFENTSSVMKDVWRFLQLDCYSSANYIKYNVGAYTPVDEKVKQELIELFKPYNKKLEEYLGMKFNW